MRAILTAVSIAHSVVFCACQTFTAEDIVATPQAVSYASFTLDQTLQVNSRPWKISITLDNPTYSTPETTTETTTEILSNLAFALSTNHPVGSAPTGTPSDAVVNLATAYTAFTDGEWTIQGKTFANQHRIHVGSPHMTKISEGEKFVSVELCKPVWADSITGFGPNNKDYLVRPQAEGRQTTTWADVDCNCGECSDKCGLRNSRLDLPCTDQSYVSQARKINQLPNGYVDLCTPYAYGQEIDSSAKEQDFCCDVKPTEFADAVRAKDGTVFFPTGTEGVSNQHTAGQPWTLTREARPSGGWYPWEAIPGDLSAEDYQDGACVLCDAYPASEDGTLQCNEFGHENITLAPTYTYTDCEPQSEDKSQIYYLYVVNAGEHSVSLSFSYRIDYHDGCPTGPSVSDARANFVSLAMVAVAITLGQFCVI